MKISTGSYLGYCWFGAVGLLLSRSTDAARGSIAHTPDSLQSFRGTDPRILEVVTTMKDSGTSGGVSSGDSGTGGTGSTGSTGGASSGDSGGSTSCSDGKCPDDYPPLLDDQCYICTPWDENKVKPTSITVMYLGGQGEISRYQSEDKTTCRDQTYPESGTVIVSEDEGGSGTSYQVSSGESF